MERKGRRAKTKTVLKPVNQGVKLPYCGHEMTPPLVGLSFLHIAFKGVFEGVPYSCNDNLQDHVNNIFAKKVDWNYRLQNLQR